MKRIKKQNGQVMLLTVLILSAVFLSVTALAGFLMTYQLRQVTNVIDGTKAIFAADAAIERGLFVVYRCNGAAGPVVPDPSTYPDDLTISFCDNIALENPDTSIPQFFNEANYRLLIESVPGSGIHDPDAGVSTVKIIKGGGRAGRAARAFGVFF